MAILRVLATFAIAAGSVYVGVYLIGWARLYFGF